MPTWAMPNICLLGTPRVRVADTWAELTPSKPTLLLIYLLLRGDWVTRDELAELLFAEVDQGTARGNLRVLLSRSVGLPWASGLEVERSRLRFQVPTDVTVFRQTLALGQVARAAELYQPLLAGFPLEGGPQFEDFLAGERLALQTQYVLALLSHAAQLRADGEWSGALQQLELALTAEPLAEQTLQDALSLCLTLQDRERGLKLYAQFVRLLREEAAAEPLSATQALAEQLRESKKAQVAHSLPEALRQNTLFLGRTAEVTRLQRALPGRVLLSGEAGMGKSTLLRSALPNARFLRCQEGLQDVPYQALITFLRQEPPAPLGPFDEDLARLLPDLYPHLQPGPFEPVTGKPRLLEALARAVIPAEIPVVLDDLQWADAATLEWLSYLWERPATSVVAAYRSEELHPALARALERWQPKAVNLALEPLNTAGMSAWLGELTGQSRPPLRFAGWLERHSGGNPFYALETLRSLFEAGVLRADERGWHTAFDDSTQDYEELPPPPRLQALVRQRTGHLSGPAQHLLAALSLHQEAPLELLTELLGYSPLETLSALEEAEAGAFLKSGRFAHDLLRQSVALSLSPARRKHLHARIAELLERGEAESSVLAWHWQQGGQPQRAWPARFAHAEQLDRRGEQQAASQVWRSLLGELPPGHALELPTRVKLGRNLFWHEMNEGAQHLQMALDLIEWGQHGPADLLKIEALVYLSEIKVYQGEGVGAEQLLDEAVTLAQHLNNLPEELRRTLIEQRVEVGFRRGQYALMRELMRAQRAPWPLLETQMALGEYFAGHFRQCINEIRRLLGKHPELAYQNAMEADIGLCCLVIGALDEGRAILEQGLARTDLGPHMQTLMLTHLASIKVVQGEFAVAQQDFARAQALAEQLGSKTYLADIYFRRSTIPLIAKQLPEALDLLRQAYELIGEVGDPYRKLYINCTYAALLAVSGDTAKAETLLRGCKIEPDSPPHAVTFYHMGWAHLHWARGEQAEGDAHFAKEAELAEQYGMMRLILLGRHLLEPDVNVLSRLG